MSRPSFERSLTDLRDNVLRLGDLAETAVGHAMQALKENNVEIARQVIHDDEKINIIRYQIEEDSYTILALKQPTARDMRTVMTAVHIAVELERIGDYAEGICKLVLKLSTEPITRPFAELYRMAATGRQMIRSGLDAYVQWDTALAQQIKTRDDEVDALYDHVYQDLVEIMKDKPHLVLRGTYLLWIAHNLERVADRATNICERVVYMVTGQVRAKLQKQLVFGDTHPLPPSAPPTEE